MATPTRRTTQTLPTASVLASQPASRKSTANGMRPAFNPVVDPIDSLCLKAGPEEGQTYAPYATAETCLVSLARRRRNRRCSSPGLLRKYRAIFVDIRNVDH